MNVDGDRSGPFRGNVRQVGFLRVSHGLFRPDQTEEEEPIPELVFRRDLEAWLLVLPDGAAYTHVTGARLRGWQLPNLPEQVPVFAAVARQDNRPRRHGLVCSRLERSIKPEAVAGLPVEPAEEILLRAARDLGVLDMVILVDSARHLGHVDEQAMDELLKSRRPGVRVLREAWTLSTARAESAGESVLRMFDQCMDVEVEPQAPLYDEAGNHVGNADLAVIGTRILHEYDGAHHREGVQQRIDLRRTRGLSQTAYDRRGYTLDDLLNHPAVLMHEIDRDLKRPHRVERLRRWRRLVDNSLYGRPGRRRVMNRWKRQMGIVDWSRTA